MFIGELCGVDDYFFMRTPFLSFLFLTLLIMSADNNLKRNQQKLMGSFRIQNYGLIATI